MVRLGADKPSLVVLYHLDALLLHPEMFLHHALIVFSLAWHKRAMLGHLALLLHHIHSFPGD